MMSEGIAEKQNAGVCGLGFLVKKALDSLQSPRSQFRSRELARVVCFDAPVADDLSQVTTEISDFGDDVDAWTDCEGEGDDNDEAIRECNSASSCPSDTTVEEQEDDNPLDHHQMVVPEYNKPSSGADADDDSPHLMKQLLKPEEESAPATKENEPFSPSPFQKDHSPPPRTSEHQPNVLVQPSVHPESTQVHETKPAPAVANPHRTKSSPLVMVLGERDYRLGFKVWRRREFILDDHVLFRRTKDGEMLKVAHMSEVSEINMRTRQTPKNKPAYILEVVFVDPTPTKGHHGHSHPLKLVLSAKSHHDIELLVEHLEHRRRMMLAAGA